MTAPPEKSVRFGVDWATVSPKVAAKVPLFVADSCGGMHIVKDRNGDTPLHCAATHSSPRVVAALTKAGASPSEQNNDGNTPLHFAAAYNKSPEVITALAEAGAKHKENNNRQTPLMVAVRRDNVDVVEELIDTGDWDDYVDYGEVGSTGTTIFWVAENVQSSEMAEAIAMEVETKIEGWFSEEPKPLVNEEGLTPLEWAVLMGNAAAIEGFIKAWGFNGAMVYTDRGSILHSATSEAVRKSVKTLIDIGVDVNYPDADGKTAMNYAVSDKDRQDIAAELRKAGGYVCDQGAGVCFGVNWKTATAADVAGIDNDARGGVFGLRGHRFAAIPVFGRPIDWAVRFCPNPEVIDALVTKGADVAGLIMMAVERNPRPEIIRALVRAGADVNESGMPERDEVVTVICGRVGESDEHINITWKPLHYAAHARNTEMVACLIEAGADVNGIMDAHDGDFGETPLDWAEGGADSDIGKMLVAAGAVSAADLPKQSDDNSSGVVDDVIAELGGWDRTYDDGNAAD